MHRLSSSKRKIGWKRRAFTQECVRYYSCHEKLHTLCTGEWLSRELLTCRAIRKEKQKGYARIIEKRTATAGMYFNAGHGSYEVYCFALPLYRYPNRRSVRTQVGTPSTGHRYSGGQRNHAAYSSAAKHSNENKGDYYRTKKRMFKTGYSAASVSHTICGTVSDRSKGICFDWRKRSIYRTAHTPKPLQELCGSVWD